MPDDARLARLEAQSELQHKHLAERMLDAETHLYRLAQESERRHQELLAAVEHTIDGRIRKVEGDRDTLERMLRDLIGARIEVVETKNAIVRSVVFGMCGVILIFVLNWMLADKFSGPKFPPQLAPAHSSKEIRQ